jgi:hypothetical protein
MKVARVLLFTMAVAFLAFGIAYAVWPDAMVKDVGLHLGESGRIDLRSVYGGMQVGIGAFLIYCAVAERRVRTGLVASLAMLGGLAGTRAIGMIQTGVTSNVMWSLLAVEAIGVPMAVAGLVLLNRRT